MSSKNTTKIERRAYYQKNKERIYASHRAYIQNHSEERGEYLRKYWANPVNKQKRRDWYKRNAEKIRKRDKEHYYRTRERHSEVYRCRKYGISRELYRELTSRELCDICGNKESSRNKRLSIDHDHGTGRIRGMLCGGCNIALGKVLEKIETLENMIAYLKKYAPTS